jgi:L-lactate dehydrogenase (cytochrome)
MNMRLLGATKLSDITPEMVDASALGVHSSSVPSDRMFDQNYETLQPTRLRAKL